MKHKKTLLIILGIIVAAIVLPLVVMLVGIAATRFVPLWAVALILLIVTAVIAWKAGVDRDPDNNRRRKNERDGRQHDATEDR